MPRGGKRAGAGAPFGNQNALKHGGRARVKYGVPLNKKLTGFEYKALCLEQMAQLKFLDEIGGGTVYTYQTYARHKRRYRGSIEFNERRNVRRSTAYQNYLYERVKMGFQEYQVFIESRKGESFKRFQRLVSQLPVDARKSVNALVEVKNKL